MRETFPVINQPRLSADGAPLPPRPVQMITCRACPTTDALNVWPSRLPPQTVAARFKARGWHVGDAGHHLCPDCRRARRKAPASPHPSAESDMPKLPAKMPTKIPDLPPAPASEGAPPVDAGRPVVSAAASRAIVTLYVVLEDAYDRERKAYKTGWDDARVAQETGLSPAEVSARRERDFGPLKAAPTADEVHAVMGELTEAWSALTSALSDLHQKRVQVTEALAKAVSLLGAR